MTEGVCIVSRVVTVLLKPISTNFLHRSILHINSIYLYIELATNWPCHDSKFAGDVQYSHRISYAAGKEKSEALKRRVSSGNVVPAVGKGEGATPRRIDF